MKTKINVCELTSKEVNFNLFFDYLNINLNDQADFNFSDIFNMFKNIKYNKYNKNNNILAETKNISDSDLINMIYNYRVYNNKINIFYDSENLLIKLKYGDSKIFLINIKLLKNYYNIFEYISDYMEYETCMLENNK